MSLNRAELSLLLYLETRAVDYGGSVDAKHMNADDFEIAKRWNESKYIEFGHICSNDVSLVQTHWVKLSEQAWTDAHIERKARYSRMNKNRTWKTTKEVKGE